METINQEQLFELLKNTTTNTIVLRTRKSAKLNKRGNPLKDENVEKESLVEYDFGGTYLERVNESAEQNGAEKMTESAPLKWGEWIKDAEGKLIQYGDKKYVRVYIKKGGLHESKFFVNGVEASEEQLKTIKEFTPTKKESENKTQTELGLSAENQVFPLNVDLTTIKEIEIEGMQYCIL